MFRTAILIVVTLISAKLIADEAMTFQSEPGDTTLQVTLTTEHLDKSPAWKAPAENSPLSARKALQLATAKRKELARDIADWKWELDYLGLKPYDDKTDKWYWLAHFESYPTKGGLGGGAPDLYLIVLMDGRVIEPKVVRE